MSQDQRQSRHLRLIPTSGPVGFKVIGFGRTPRDGHPLMRVQINALGEFDFTRKDGVWRDHLGVKQNDEETKMLETVWQGECKRVGLDPS